MNKFFQSRIPAAVLSAAAAALVFSGAAFAAAPSGRENSAAAQRSNPAAQNASGTLERGAAGSRLHDAKLKACQGRENGIKRRSTHLTDLAKNMEDTFDAIAQRVEEYYTNTVVPSGKTVSNYNALTSDIKTEKAAVEDAATKAQNDASGFSCAADNPKALLADFRTDMQAVKQALKKYRTSIKNLIVAVHSVTGEENRNVSSSETGHPNIPASSSSRGREQ